MKLEEKKSVPKVKSARSRKRMDNIWSWCIMILPVIGFFAFTLYPMIWTMQKGFYYYDKVPSNTRFVGWENFITAMQDKTYWRVWISTFKFAIYKLPVEIPLALLLANFLRREIKCKGLFRAIYFMPTLISVAVVGIIISNMFEYFGFFNAFLMKMGLIDAPKNWFENGTTAMIVLSTIGSTWTSFGINTLYFVSAFANVPEDLYEASAIDGANAVQQFFKITLPMIAPVMSTILLFAIKGTLQTNEYILVTTGGAPGGQTFTIMAYLAKLYMPGFSEQGVNLGYGSAISMITSVIMMAIALTYQKLSNKMRSIY